MIEEMDDRQIDEVLLSQTVGRIGCHADSLTYVVPVTYVYDNNGIHGHLDQGLKVRLMRANPKVCFEVEQIEDISHWKTVIAWGTFLELSGDEAEKARILLSRRLSHLIKSNTADLSLDRASYVDYRLHTLGSHGTMYRIEITKKTGRLER
ncbi:MAG TPA: pyridoxamine 5'-phosphate oxidase family protein [Blastocatellia bacterium]|nr:pyridoxamine 5'-phosphate oxidase family protein [Blastocatellia bacterium]